MDIVVIILGVLMSIILGYLINEWRHIIKKEKKAEKLSKESIDRFITNYPKTPNESFKTITYTDVFGLNYHSTSTQGPPRKSVIATLEDRLIAALEDEDYELAAKLRDELIKIQYNKNK